MGLSKHNRLFLLKPVADIEDLKSFKLEQNSTSTLEPQQKLKILTLMILTLVILTLTILK